MSTKKNTNKGNTSYPIRVYVSVIGLALFTFFTFFGFFLKDGDMPMSLVYAIAFTAILSVILGIMTYAKRREDNDLRKWKIVEFSLLGAYLILAVIFAEPTLRFFAVNADKENMKASASEDIDNYYRLLDKFKNEQSSALDAQVTGMYNAVSSSSNQSDEVRSFLREKNIAGRDNISGYQEGVQNTINVKEEYFRKELSNCKSAIDQWKLMEIPNVVNRLKKYYDILPEELVKFTNENQFPTIERRSDGKYWLGEAPTFTYSAAEPIFPDKVKNSTDITPLAAIIFVFLHTVILFAYYMAKRTKMANSTFVDEGGTLLDFK